MINTNLTRWSVNFDLKITKLKKFYGKNYKHAWSMLKTIMEKYGFQHDQHSGYITIKEMSRYEAYKLFDRVIKELPWVIKSANVCKITRFAGDEDMIRHYKNISALKNL